MEHRNRALHEIQSTSPYVIFCPIRGLVSEHASAAEAIRQLAVHRETNPRSAAAIYARTQIDWMIF